MTWFVSKWRWIAFNLLAGTVLVTLLSQSGLDWGPTPTFDPELESGKWAIRFLLICLTITPLNTYFGWRGMIPLRKPAGLWSFGFACLHLLFYIREAGLAWLTRPLSLFIVPGLVGLLILSALALTSNRWAMRRLKKGWKRLHRLIYLAGPLVIYHAILATEASKKVMVYDPQAIRELNLYMAVLAVLLMVRIPVVRRFLTHRRSLRRSQRPVERPVTVALPDSLPNYQPQSNGRQTTVPLDERLTEVHGEKEVEGVV